MNREYESIYFKDENGRVIHAKRVGRGKRLFYHIHGLANSWESMKLYVDLDLEDEFTFVGIDLLGFGESARQESYTLEDQCMVAEEFLHWYMNLHGGEYESVVVVGLSLGAIIGSSLLFAQQPKVKGFVLIAPLFANDVNRALVRSTRRISNLLQNNRTFSLMYERIFKSTLTSYFLAYTMGMHRFNRSMLDKYAVNGKKSMDLDAYIDILRELQGTNTYANLASSNDDKEVLMLLGRHDKYVNHDQVLAKDSPIYTVPNLKVKVLDTGHLVPYEMPYETYSLIRNFVSEFQV